MRKMTYNENCQACLTMTINALWNRRYGPGGGTRRLHQIPRVLRFV